MNKELTVKLEDLFRWTGEVSITDNDGAIIETLYQRIISDSDSQKVRLLGLKESKLLRRKLKDKESDEYIAMMPIYGDITLDEMLVMVSIGKYRDFRNQAALKVVEEKVPEPDSDADLEEQENYVEEIERVHKEYDEKLAEETSKITEKYMESLKEKGYDEIFSMYEKSNIDYLCQLKMIQIFDEASTYFGTYKDKKFTKKRFSSFENFQDLHPIIKQKLVDGYKNLLLSFDDLKK